MADNVLVAYGVPLVLLILSPFIGGLLIGIDRKVTARIQNRAGPPIVQPFYDALKLFGKEDKVVNKTYLVFGAAYLLTVILSLALLLFQYDLLITTFIFGLSFIFLVLAGYSTRSQFGNLGATRELMQMLTYEPILLLAVFLIRLVTGSFEVEVHLRRRSAAALHAAAGAAGHLRHTPHKGTQVALRHRGCAPGDRPGA